MVRGARRGAALVEVMLLAAMLAAAASGLGGLAASALRAEGEARRRMEARNAVLEALEARAAGLPAPAGCGLRRKGPRVEARRAWREGNRDRELVLGCWCPGE